MTDETKKSSPPTEDFAALFAASEQGHKRTRGPRYSIGDRVTGRLVSIGRDIAVVELAGGGEGTLEMPELRDATGQLIAQVGDTIEARVSAKGDKEGIVSLRRAPLRAADGSAGIAQAATSGLPVEGQVTGVNKGGLEVMVGGVRAFCPISQIELRQVTDASVYVGQRMEFRVTRFEEAEEDHRGPNVVLSRRALLEEDARERAVATRGTLTVGAVVTGVVSSLKDFGAFVDLGGIDGLLPASEIGYQRGTRPADVLSVGQTVSVQILRMEKREARPGARTRGTTEQITLSLKALERDPWIDATANLRPGTTVHGKVTRTEAFGAFIEILPGIEGLLHISELAGGRQLRHAREAVKAGDPLDVTVLSVDSEKRRVSLGIASEEDRIDDEGRAAVSRASAPQGGSGGGGGMGTFGDLLKGKLSK
jgi:small subunit ribosomal protein S1